MTNQQHTCVECRVVFSAGSIGTSGSIHIDPDHVLAYYVVEPCSLHAQAEATAKERDEAVTLLRQLTPGGSEFQTPLECAAYVERRKYETHILLLRHTKEQKALLEALERCLEPIEALNMLDDSGEGAVIAAQARAAIAAARGDEH